MNELDATPTKRLYRSIIADYDLRTALAELIDNAIDAWSEKRGGPDLTVDIDVDIDQQFISIQDNAGGIKESELVNLISPGSTSASGSTAIIGIFGVGSKRAVVAIAQDIKIYSRFHTLSTYRVEYDDEWLNDLGTWKVGYQICDDIKPSSTRIELSRLRMKIDESGMRDLREFLSATYAKLLEKDEISIVLNGKQIAGKTFENWSFHPQYGPRTFRRRIKYRGSREQIKLELTGGLVRERGHEHGVYIYCNNRLICRALKVPEVGFKAARTGHHVNYSLARVIVKLDGPSASMPWTSNKSNLNYSHEIFREIQNDINKVVEKYKQLSSRLFKTFELEVLPHAEGELPPPERLKQGEPLRPSKLPPIPKVKKDYKTETIELNADLTKTQPWVRGLYEAIIAEEMIARQLILKQSQRISIIILDSTIEIGFKEYLAWKRGLGDGKLQELFGNRIEVHKKMREYLPLTPDEWHSIDYLYKLRCELIHRKANVKIDPEDLISYRSLTKYVLGEAFGLKFSF